MSIKECVNETNRQKKEISSTRQIIYTEEKKRHDDIEVRANNRIKAMSIKYSYRNDKCQLKRTIFHEHFFVQVHISTEP